MTSTEYPDQSARASISKRELRALARRWAPSERPELRAVARALDKALAGEPYGTRHHEGDDYDPFRCAQCQPDLWVIYAIGVAFPDALATGLGVLAGMHGLSEEDILLALDNGRDEREPPDVTLKWLAMRDRQDDEEMEVKSALEPGWTKHGHHWGRTYDGAKPPPNDPDVDTLIAEIREGHSTECDRFLATHSHGPSSTWRGGRPMYRLGPDPALIEEIRFGSDPRKARALKRASLRKGFDASWLI